MGLYDVLGLLAALALGMCSVFTLVHAFGDYREFNRIVKQCETQGFIQNDKQRIICSKELK